jgi:hypothetical protein
MQKLKSFKFFLVVKVSFGENVRMNWYSFKFFLVVKVSFGENVRMNWYSLNVHTI